MDNLPRQISILGSHSNFMDSYFRLWLYPPATELGG